MDKKYTYTKMSKILIHKFGGLFLDSGTKRPLSPYPLSEDEDDHPTPHKKSKKGDVSSLSNKELGELVVLLGLEKEGDGLGGYTEPPDYSDAVMDKIFEQENEEKLRKKEELSRIHAGLVDELNELDVKFKQLQTEEQKRDIIQRLADKLKLRCDAEDMEMKETKMVKKWEKILILNFVLAFIYLQRNEKGEKKIREVKAFFNQMTRTMKINKINESVVDPTEIINYIIENKFTHKERVLSACESLITENEFVQLYV